MAVLTSGGARILGRSAGAGLAVALSLLGCSGGAAPTPQIVFVTPDPLTAVQPTPEIIYITPEPVEPPTPEVIYLTPEPVPPPTPQIIYVTPEPTPELQPTPEPTREPTPEPTPEPTATPTPRPSRATTPEPTPQTTPEPTSPAGFGEGTQIVGDDIRPGTYRSPGGDSCYWERLAGFSGEFDDIIANGFADTNPVVRIRASDAGFHSERCGRWRLVD